MTSYADYIDWDRLDPSELRTPLRSLAERFGMGPVRHLIERHGGADLYVPALKETGIRHRNERIRELREAGYAVNDIATRLRVSEYTVRRAL